MPRPSVDLTGKQFGRIIVLRKGERRGHNQLWECRCECGNIIRLRADHLQRGESRSCGCRQGFFKHGHAMTSGASPEYISWMNMRKRCYDTKHESYPDYGGAGIVVCERWRNDFAAFLADMGLKPTPRHTIERIDGTKGYSPENCKWATQAEQNRNTSQNRNITIDGRTQCLADWAKEKGRKLATIHYRVNRGMTFEDAILTPIRRAAR